MSHEPGAARSDFQERLARIGSDQSLSGDETLIPRQARTAHQKFPPSRTRELGQNALYPLSIILACCLGMLSVLVSRFVRYHMIGADNPDLGPDILLAVDAGMAFAVAFALRMLFQLTNAVYLSAKAVGIFVMIATMHNLVHFFPAIWVPVFDQAWVDLMIESSEPNTVMIKGFIFKL